MPMVTRSGAGSTPTRVTNFYRATKRQHSPVDERKKNQRGEKKENTPTKKIRERASSKEDFTSSDTFIRAKRCLGLGQTAYKIVGRETEMEKLVSFVKENVEQRNSASLYISGLPGMGKTMCLKRTIDLLQNEIEFNPVWVNCMNVDSLGDFCARICDLVGSDDGKKLKRRTPSKRTFKDVKDQMASEEKIIVLCLDEIDQLYEKFPSLLSQVFRLVMSSGSNVVLIGIANSCDLMDRCLHELDAVNGIKPQVLNFRPYTVDEVVSIVKERLSGCTDALEPKAIELCARKCVAVSGDVRKALDTCKLALQQARARQMTNSPLSTPVAPCTTSDVLAAWQDVRSPLKQNSRYGVLPVQQKLLFAAALSLSTNGCKQISMNKLYDEYKRVCDTAHVPTIGSSEGQSLCGLLESNGLLRRSSKLDQSTKYTLNVNEKQAREVINDDRLLSALLGHQH